MWQCLLMLNVHQKVVGTANTGAIVAFSMVLLGTTTKYQMDNNYTTALKGATTCIQEILLIQ